MNDIITMLDVLNDGLTKKLKNLNEILHYTKQQEEILKVTPFNLKVFNNIIKNKQFRIDTVRQIDDGFAPMYERVRVYLEKSPEVYREYIERMKTSIKLIADINVEIQVLEQRNHKNFIQATNNMKQEVRKFRTSKKAVTNYYSTYNKQQESVRKKFFDSKN